MSDSYTPHDIETIIKAMAEHGVASLRLGDLHIAMQLGAAHAGQAHKPYTAQDLFHAAHPVAEPSLAKSPSEINKALEKMQKTAAQYRNWGAMKPPTVEQADG